MENLDHNSREWRNLRVEILERDGRKCFICGARFLLTVHHIKPRSEDGSDDPKNLITLCHSCHDKVEGKDWEEVIYRKEIKKDESKISNRDLIAYGTKIDMYRFLGGKRIKIGERYEI